MIRIDEIYNNTFWPWMQANRPGTRMFFHDPFGRTDIDSLFNYGRDSKESNYIYFFDQEPLHLDIHNETFDEVVTRNTDISWPYRTPGSLVTSEKDSENVQSIREKHGWTAYYYFFHGWAAIDWYRGYDRTFLIPPPQQRIINRSFISANRVIGGRRDHRILLMYHLLRQDITNAWISFPRVCPEEQKDILELCGKFGVDVQRIFRDADLPRCFPGETNHPMHSCWLSLFAENASSLAHVVTETVYHGRRYHLTEKTFKPICLQVPFIMVSTAGSLEYLRSYGFKTFEHLWNEDYDLERDDTARLIKVSRLLKDLDEQSPDELQKIYKAAIPVLEHNYRHFYGGDFEKILWQELSQMLLQIKKDGHAS